MRGFNMDTGFIFLLISFIGVALMGFVLYLSLKMLKDERTNTKKELLFVKFFSGIGIFIVCILTILLITSDFGPPTGGIMRFSNECGFLMVTIILCIIWSIYGLWYFVIQKKRTN